MTVNSIPKRRWLQFSLRTLLIVVTLTAVSLGWWQHRSYCLARAQVHDWEVLVCLITTIDTGTGRWEEDVPQRPVDTVKLAEDERLTKLSKLHAETSAVFRLAVWFPWLRWSIHEPPIDVDSEQNPSQ